MEIHKIKSINRDEILTLIEGNRDDFLLLDVRDKSEYLQSHLPGAEHMLIRDFAANAKLVFPAYKIIITYSEGPLCPASTIAAKNLQDLGFNTADYQGSYKDWVDAGLPLESDE